MTKESMQAILLRAGEDPTYHKAALETIPIPELTDDRDVLVKVGASALNHREIWIRNGAYGPTLGFGTIMGADGAGIVEAVKSDEDKHLVGKKVLINCSINWDSSPDGPEIPEKYALLGFLPVPGTLADYIAIPSKYIHEIPSHLTITESAAIPLAALTAWRALFSKGRAKAGDRVLVTGIGGGVALWALQYAVADGCDVYVTSSSPEKIEKAKKLGAKGGVNYREAKWPEQLKEMLKEHRPDARPEIDVIIDGACSGVDDMVSTLRLNGAIVCYGVTSARTDASAIKAPNFAGMFLKQVEWRGSTMGSAREFRDALAFIDKHKIKPVITQPICKGLGEAEKAFDMMKNGQQFGKIVIEVAKLD